jgi:putative transposase
MALSTSMPCSIVPIASASASTLVSATMLGKRLGHSKIRRFGALTKGDAEVTLRTDNALVYASELYRELAKSYGLHQEFILPHTPEQNGVAESFMGTLKLECVWQHRFETYEEAKATITAWVKHYNEMRPHSRLGYILPVSWRELQAELIG